MRAAALVVVAALAACGEPPTLVAPEGWTRVAPGDARAAPLAGRLPATYCDPKTFLVTRDAAGDTAVGCARALRRNAEPRDAEIATEARGLEQAYAAILGRDGRFTVDEQTTDDLDGAEVIHLAGHYDALEGTPESRRDVTVWYLPGAHAGVVVLYDLPGRVSSTLAGPIRGALHASSGVAGSVWSRDWGGILGLLGVLALLGWMLHVWRGGRRALKAELAAPPPPPERDDV